MRQLERRGSVFCFEFATMAPANDQAPPMLLKRWKHAVTLNTSTVVQLNVRGTRFVATKASLLAAASSYFPVMFQSASTCDGEYFVDVDPTHFHRVLCFLQHGEFSCDGLNGYECRELRATASFLNLTLPHLAAWAWVPPLIDTPYSLTEKNSVLRCSRHGATIISDTPVYSFRLQFSDWRSSYSVFIGFTPPAENGFLQGDTVRIKESDRRGFYVCLPGWTLFGPGDVTERPQKVPNGYSNSGNFDLSVALDGTNTIHFRSGRVPLGKAAFHVPGPCNPMFPTVHVEPGSMYNGSITILE
ncbi:Aste57867_19434 [Aphanomyces stellatus]|uniref:Aste57867_19434 protein n=1 Tax=Aphanomyces stellatus TaxID=120398 RepID=A0A485LDC4_9STRA|nr:hypothetical protein As57867_019370 [Aphanomyces stellatus]VFT96148.1 Aste57867_19434 [Aphanomyces stellatus]